VQLPRGSTICAPHDLVNFDPEGYRLGYGGGSFDRTLAVLRPRPLAIGVGHPAGLNSRGWRWCSLMVGTRA
jgi:5-formyltetrahydrofolate cyclo-ligase